MIRVRLLAAIVAVSLLAGGCGTVAEAGSNTPDSTTTSTTAHTDVTAVPAADMPGGIPAAEALVEQLRREDEAAAAAFAAAHPNYEALQAKAHDIVDRFHHDPGLWSMNADPEEDIVHVRVDDESLYETLVAEFVDDPEVVIHLGPNCSIPLVLPPDPLSEACK